MMYGKGMTFAVCLLLASVMLFNLVSQAEAAYRKPPFNGSIFGKRANGIEYESASKTLSAMCEIASEACQAWFPAADAKK